MSNQCLKKQKKNIRYKIVITFYIIYFLTFLTASLILASPSFIWFFRAFLRLAPPSSIWFLRLVSSGILGSLGILARFSLQIKFLKKVQVAIIKLIISLNSIHLLKNIYDYFNSLQVVTTPL